MLIRHYTERNPMSVSSLSNACGSESGESISASPSASSTTRQPGVLQTLDSYDYTVSIIVVSFNTRDLLRECLQSILKECDRLPDGITAEILVVDNASTDLSAEMVASEFASSGSPVRLIRSKINLGFAGANNLAMEMARGRYLVLLNSDAFFHSGALSRAIEHVDSDATVGLGGARLVGPSGNWQPSARAFPGIWNGFFVLSGLASRYPKSRIFGSFDRTWDDPFLAAEVDWVPGAFSIMRREALAKAGLFDTRFFLYCEEVDLCRRIKAAGFRILYWPDVAVTHIGGESSRKLTALKFSDGEAQVVLWRMRATLLYFRKHHGMRVWGIRLLEDAMHKLRWLRRRNSNNPAQRERAEEAKVHLALMRQAWKETNGGRISPPRPW